MHPLTPNRLCLFLLVCATAYVCVATISILPDLHSLIGNSQFHPTRVPGSIKAVRLPWDRSPRAHQRQRQGDQNRHDCNGSHPCCRRWALSSSHSPAPSLTYAPALMPASPLLLPHVYLTPPQSESQHKTTVALPPPGAFDIWCWHWQIKEHQPLAHQEQEDDVL